jgi:alkylation response protein AidB-like acyl-CoA dehydrogenase
LETREEPQMPDSPEPDEREMFRESVRSLLKRVDPIAEVREDKCGAPGYLAASWQEFSTQLGAGGALVPEEQGGLGLRFGDVCAMLEETGAACYNGPFLSSGVLAVLALLASDQDVAADLEALAAGTRTAAVSGLHWGPDPSSWAAEVEATQGADGWTLAGTASSVIHGAGADVVYVVGRVAGQTGIWAVDADAPGHTAHPLVTLDLTRAQSDHTFATAPAQLVLTPSEDLTRLRAIAAVATIAVSAEQVGAASQRLAETIEYARTRYQFGRAIGSFQALKHRCVDMAILVEGAVASSVSAQEVVDAYGDLRACLTSPSPELLRAAAIAGAWCSDASMKVASASLQIHGGIGMAWEHDSHLYLRRAKASERLFGDPVQHRAALLATL